jgi:hypothetical protein
MNENEQLSHIKKVGETDRISREEFEYRITELAKCKRDICYFAEKYFKIINLDAGLMTIKLYPKQRELLRFFAGEKRCIVLASRQSSKCVGFWTLITIRHKKIPLKIKIPIGIFYWLTKLFKIFR